MDGNNSYDEKQRGCNCNETVDQIRGILVCKKCETACINQRDNTSAKKECEKIVRSIDALLLKKGKHLHEILQRSLEGKANSDDENTAAELCSKYVFSIKPEIKEWLETGHFPSVFNKKVYQLLEIENKIMDALEKLEDS